ncbi:MAG: type transport system permease protein [Actinomycetota bacterium]|nr:type transport system permease protein [Actinomycetota bacterium]
MSAAAITVDVPAPRRTRHWVALWWALSRKNFQVRYKRASLGMMWVVIQPTLQALVVAFVFQRVFRITGTDRYPAFVLAGMLPWAYFAQGVNAATTAIVENSALVKKVAVPLLLFPLASVGGIALTFMASLVVMLVVGVVNGHLGPVYLLLPAVVLQSLLIGGLGALTCSFNVAYRDVRYAVESALVIGFYATPVFYTLDRLPPGARRLLRFNPMDGILSLYRAAILDRPVDGAAVAWSIGITTAFLVVGLAAFRWRSREFADLV